MDVFNPIISDHCWWCGQEHLTVHAQNPKKKIYFFLTVLKMSILSLDKLGLGKLLLNCMYIFLQFIFTFKSTVHESATEIAPSYFFF